MSIPFLLVSGPIKNRMWKKCWGAHKAGGTQRTEVDSRWQSVPMSEIVTETMHPGSREKQWAEVLRQIHLPVCVNYSHEQSPPKNHTSECTHLHIRAPSPGQHPPYPALPTKKQGAHITMSSERLGDLVWHLELNDKKTTVLPKSRLFTNPWTAPDQDSPSSFTLKSNAPTETPAIDIPCSCCPFLDHTDISHLSPSPNSRPSESEL